jgi:hypothetical protein
MFPTYSLRESTGCERKLPQCSRLGDLLETGEWIVRIDGQYPAASISRFLFLEEGNWIPLTKLPVYYSGGGYPLYTTTAVLRFDTQSIGNCLVEAVKIMEKKKGSVKYQQLVELQKPI